jgi:general secretion pathway protein F/type IV pilus assembly protein PilC
MPDFTYEALAATGQRMQGVVTAGSEREVLSQLDARGLFPLKIEAAQEKGAKRWVGGRIKSRVVAGLFSQLADLLRSGVPLLRSLEILERQSSQPALQGVIRDVHLQVADGTSLAEAMGRHPEAFNELAISMVRAGQEGGFLEDVLDRIAVFSEHQEDLKAKVVGALAYPVFLMIVLVCVLFAVVIFVVPLFEPMFKRLDEKGELPALTVGLISFSKFMISYWPVAIVAVVIFVLWFRSWARTESGRMRLDAIRLKLPLAGTLYLSYALSRFTRILGTLLHNGIPILQSLRIAKDSTGNRVLAKAIDQAADNVTAGDSLAKPLAACPYFPRDIVEMVAVGEESNNLEKVLLDVANGLEKRTNRHLELFVRLLEPLMLLFMAGLILIVVAGLMLPVFKMSRAIG